MVYQFTGMLYKFAHLLLNSRRQFMHWKTFIYIMSLYVHWILNLKNILSLQSLRRKTFKRCELKMCVLDTKVTPFYLGMKGYGQKRLRSVIFELQNSENDVASSNIILNALGRVPSMK